MRLKEQLNRLISWIKNRDLPASSQKAKGFCTSIRRRNLPSLVLLHYWEGFLWQSKKEQKERVAGDREGGNSFLYYSSAETPRSRSTTSFLYRRSPRELIRIAGSFPRLPHLFIVRGETLRSSATSRIVIRSGKSVSDIFFPSLTPFDMVCSIKRYLYIVNIILSQKPLRNLVGCAQLDMAA